MSKIHTSTKGRYAPMVQLRVDTEAEDYKCRISIAEKNADKAPTEQYVPHKIDLSKIRLLSQEIYHILNASSASSVSNNFNSEKYLKDAGRDLYNHLFPIQIKEELARIRSRSLLLIIHDSLVGIPWESLHDGKEFLCLGFNMGRSVYTSHPIQKINLQDQREEIRMSILANPTHDLPKSYDEGVDLYHNLEMMTDLLDVSFETKDINISKVSRHLLDFDILHYAGHAVYNPAESDLCGWCLEDDVLTPQQIMQLSGGQSPFPSLIFANACQSGQTEEWAEIQQDELDNSRIFDLVNAFLRCGVRHYIGTFGHIQDPFSFSVSLHFYNLLIQSHSIGESLRHARLRMIEKHGKNNLIWAHYVLYGDPTTCYFLQKGVKGYKRTGGYISKKISPGGKKRVKGSSDAPQAVLSENRGSIAGTHDSSTCYKGKVSLALRDKKPYKKEAEKKEKDKGYGILWPKKWSKGIAYAIGIAALLLFLFAGIIITAGILFRPPRHLPLEHPPFPRNIDHMDIDLAWENKKWEIVKDIQEKLNKQFLGHAKKEKILSGSADPVRSSQAYIPNSHGLSSIPEFTMCIMPEIPVGKDTITDKWTTKKLIGEFILFFSRKKGYVVVERERLDFVLQELERATSDLSESKIRFTLGRIFGARGILFVLALKPQDCFYIPFLNHKTDVYLRLVDTETTAIKAATEKSFEIKNLKTASKQLAEEILLLLAKEEQ